MCRPVGLSVVDSRKLKSAVIPEIGEGREVGPSEKDGAPPGGKEKEKTVEKAVETDPPHFTHGTPMPIVPATMVKRISGEFIPMGELTEEAL